jgi:hypothetical protein
MYTNHCKIRIMEKIEIYVGIPTAILSVAYPILLQVIANLDQKYSSSAIVKLFDNESEKKWFKRLLISSLVLIAIWSFKFQSLVHMEGWNYLIDNSAAILIIINTIALVVVFFLFISKILVYSTPAKFINYLMKMHSKKYPDLTHFNAITDVFLISVERKNRDVSDVLSRFFYDDFKKIRDTFNSKPIEYPTEYYLLVHKSIEELAMQTNKKNSALEYRTSGGVWLIGEGDGLEISELTYTWLWRNISLAVKYEQDDMIMYYWEKAHQYISFDLKYIQQEYDGYDVKNQADIDKQKVQKERLLEFCYALGGLLLYSERYSLLNRIFNYTTSQPPKYELLPSTMNEIFETFLKFRDPHNSNFTWISSKYNFPGQNGMNSDALIKKWICSYLSVLFLRQYTIVPHLIYMEPLAEPKIPTTQGEKQEFIRNLDFFENLVSDSLKNDSLIDKLKYKFLTREWAKENDKKYPVDFIKEFKKKLQNEYEKGAVNLTIDGEKVKSFYGKTSEIIENIIGVYKSINSTKNITTDYNRWFINGKRMIQEKDAFSEEPEAHHDNFDTFLAETISSDIREKIANTFILNQPKSYLIKSGELFSAIEHLKINENYIIISFDINIPNYIKHHQINGLSDNNFNGIDLINLPSSHAVRNSLFIIKKEDLPSIQSNEIPAESITKYQLEKISKEINLYASVIDLNNADPAIIEGNLKDTSEEDLKKSVLLSIVQSIEIRWKKSSPLVQLIEYSEYRHKGLPNDLSDIIPFRTDKTNNNAENPTKDH